MIPTIIQLGPLPIHSFGLMMVLAFFSAWRRYALSLEIAGKRVALAERVITWGAVGGIVGARLGYVISFPNDLLHNPLSTIFSSAGFVFHWGFIGGVLAIWVLLKKEKEDFLVFADLAGPALAVGYAVGRLGCQLSGDGDYGYASTLPWAMSYALGVIPTAVGERVHPAPMYESMMSVAIAFILLSTPVQNRLKKTGQLFGLYLILAGIARFLVECVRIEPVVLPPFTQAQLVSVMSMLIGIWLICRKSANLSK